MVRVDKFVELAHLMLPNTDFLNNEDLFIRTSCADTTFQGKLQKVYVRKFNTWMNVFSVKTYLQYTDIKKIFLRIKTDCDCELQLCNFAYNDVYPEKEDIVQSVHIKKDNEHYIEIVELYKLDNLFFKIISLNENIKISASWVTTQKPILNNKLALITCTFKREEYVIKNILLFKNFIEMNPDLKERISLYVIDNGKTLSAELETENIKIFSNNNVGGAGGFTRGIIEVLKNKSFTRFLLMDDDIEVYAESFYRTLIFSDYLKPQYEKAFINGAMLNLYRRNIFIESHALQNVNWCYSYHGELDISVPNNIAKVNYAPVSLFEQVDKKVSSAWWYCCCSIKSVQEKGLPLPLFFRCDDIEWSWRNFGEHHISMNGISVWHSPFEGRVSKPVEYYFSKRNSIFINLLYNKDYKNKLMLCLKKDFKHLLRIYDYSSCKIYLRMMEDVLSGSKVFELNQEEILKELSNFIKSDHIGAILNQMICAKMAQKYQINNEGKKKYRRIVYVLKRILYFITYNGLLLPQFMWKKEKNIWFDAPEMEYIFSKKINIYNFMLRSFETREYDSSMSSELLKKFKYLYKQIDRNYDLILKDYLNNKEKFTSIEFWEKYLELDRENLSHVK